MSYFVPNEVSFITLIYRKVRPMVIGSKWKLRVNLLYLSNRNQSFCMTKWVCRMITPGHMSAINILREANNYELLEPNESITRERYRSQIMHDKYIVQRWNKKSYRTRRVFQTSLPTTATCSGRCSMKCSLHINNANNGSMIKLPQLTSRFSVPVSANCQIDGNKCWSTMDTTLNKLFETFLQNIKVYLEKN